MLDVVKFTWRNKHGYWIPVAWITVLSEDGDDRVRSRASLGRPGLTDLRVLDRATIPEELRLTGRSGWYLANVVLYDPKANEYTATEFLEAMTVTTA